MEKPTIKQRAEAFVTFLWDSENSKVLGRGGKSWAEIGLFYLIYYACLASFFSATIAIFYTTIEDNTPRLLSDSSLLDGNPGMGFRPMPDASDPKVVGKLTKGKNKGAVNNIKDFLKPYEKADKKVFDCENIKEPRPGGKVPCDVDLEKLQEKCKESNDYGMLDGEPCVLLKLNKVYGWIPKLWKDADDSSLPDDVKDTYKDTVIPIKCYAKDDSDADKLGEVVYHPQPGFPVSYFPYLNQVDYLAPLIFVQFPNITKDKTFKIQCRAYAKNIEFDSTEMQGGVEFELEMDS